MNVVRSTCAGQVIFFNAISSTSSWKLAIMTSLATNHVHFDVKNPTAYSIARSREASLNTIPAIDVTKYTSGQSDFFSGQQTFDGDNTITKDRPRLKSTTKPNATIVFSQTAIIKFHSS